MALEHVFYNAINSIILILVLIFLLNQQLIKAVKSIASKLHTITPGSEQRLQVDNIHSKDEIGMLVADINQLLASAESQLKQERTLRSEVEVLERHFRNIFEQTSGGLALIDQSGYIQIQNPSFEKIIGIENSARLTNTPKQSLFTLFGLTDEASLSHFYQSLNAKQPFTTDIKLSHVNSETWIQCAISRVTKHGEQQLFEVLIHDVSERRKREDNFKTQADHDPLTGVYNRRAGKRKVQRLLNSARESDSGFAVLMIDIDNFKPINDQYGHKTGDKVLMSLTQKILNVVRTEDIVIRWGGDEFLLIIKQNLNDAGINKVAEKLIETFRTGIEIEPQLSINIGASIGIALYPEHGQTIDVLTHYADEAMYSIKSQSKDGYAIYTHPIIDNDNVTDDEILH